MGQIWRSAKAKPLGRAPNSLTITSASQFSAEGSAACPISDQNQARPKMIRRHLCDDHCRLQRREPTIQASRAQSANSGSRSHCKVSHTGCPMGAVSLPKPEAGRRGAEDLASFFGRQEVNIQSTLQSLIGLRTAPNRTKSIKRYGLLRRASQIIHFSKRRLGDFRYTPTPCAEFLPLCHRGLGSFTVTVLPIPLVSVS